MPTSTTESTQSHVAKMLRDGRKSENLKLGESVSSSGWQYYGDGVYCCSIDTDKATHNRILTIRKNTT